MFSVPPDDTELGMKKALLRRACLVLATLFAITASAQPIHFPTANHALYERGGEEKFFVGTTGMPWTSGTFGCVRSGGHQMHEGLDIKCLQRDNHGEPTDPVLATADGTVVYFSDKPALSNYGRYIVLRHVIDNLEIYSLYAHLHEIRPGLKIGQTVATGEKIAIMGRTSNTHETISKERAHVHFELNLLYTDRFGRWFKKNSPNEHNDHGDFNGQNLAGIDPRLILLAERDQGAKFNLLTWLQSRPELCRVFVRKTDFPFLKRYPALVAPASGKKPIVGYEISLDYNGVPLRLTPRAADEIKSKAKYQLLSVNEPEQQKKPARKLVLKRGSHWELNTHGQNLLNLLTD